MLDISVKILADGQAQSIGLQSQRMHQIAECAQFFQCSLHRSFDFVAEDRRGAAWPNFGSESHQIEAGSDKVLSRRVVQRLRDTLALFLLKRYQALSSLANVSLSKPHKPLGSAAVTANPAMKALPTTCVRSSVENVALFAITSSLWLDFVRARIHSELLVFRGVLEHSSTHQ